MAIEEPLDRDQQICDPHHHLWQHPNSTYLLDELKADLRIGGNVVKTVFVECRSRYRQDGPEVLRPVGETEWVASLATDGLMAGIVGFADLTLGESVREVLDAHIQAGRGRFRGIRHASAWDASPDIRPAHTNPPADLFDLPGFAAGLRALGGAGLSFDAWLYFRQLPGFAALARAHPDVTMILDHIGGPIGIGPYRGRRHEVLAEWRTALADVATCANVYLKVGGIGMSILGMDWHHRDKPPSSEEVAATWGPELTWCIDTFGPERCMFESNFPVDKASFGYDVCWNVFRIVASGYSETERAQLFHDSAARAYRLE